MLKDPAAMAGFAGILNEENIVPEVTKQAFRFHEAFRIASGKARWADKTPQYVPYYEDIVRYAPQHTQFVVIFRDPFDVVHSIYSRGWVLERLDEDPLINTCLYVRNTLSRLNDIAKRRNVHVLTYEALVGDPAEETRKLCEFLREPWDSSMLQPWASAHNFGTEDPIVRSRKKFELSAGHWRSLAASDLDRLQQYLGEMRAALGYLKETGLS
jgi:hypothetical protein